MQSAVDITSAAFVIQQAVAPVFLLTGVGTLLAVLTNRLARIVDRFRALDSGTEKSLTMVQDEMKLLSRRARWVHRAITLCTLCALFICLVITVLFIGAELRLDPSATIAVLFITGIVALIAGLLCFLREIALATGGIDVYMRR